MRARSAAPGSCTGLRITSVGLGLRYGVAHL